MTKDASGALKPMAGALKRRLKLVEELDQEPMPSVWPGVAWVLFLFVCVCVFPIF